MQFGAAAWPNDFLNPQTLWRKTSYNIPFGTFSVIFEAFFDYFTVFRPFFAENCIFLEFFWCNNLKIFGSKCTQEPHEPIPADPDPISNIFIWVPKSPSK